jgi:hypothetical protein
MKKAAADNRRILFTPPREVRTWLEERAAYHGGTMSQEVNRSIRERMERERAAAKDRATGTAGRP